ncbi:hypothetical protein [Formosa haliotis]|uniref:hypothetical protein n=1 Tax=Formosa haliotis TaxID=1555194 RepID=UPI000824F561|nr:hypothetical protein [Formosa haliotis]
MRFFKNYLFLLSTLVLSGFATLYANLDSCTIENASQEESRQTNPDFKSTLLSFGSVISSHSSTEHKASFIEELINNENLENEAVTSDNFLNNSLSAAALKNAQQLQFLAVQHQNDVYRFQSNTTVSLLRLHVKFQVFRI